MTTQQKRLAYAVGDSAHPLMATNGAKPRRHARFFTSRQRALTRDWKTFFPNGFDSLPILFRGEEACICLSKRPPAAEISAARA